MTIVRDIVCLVFGTGLLVYEELSPDPSLYRLALFALMMSAPGAFAAVVMARSAIGGSSSASPSPPSPPPSPLPPPDGEP